MIFTELSRPVRGGGEEGPQPDDLGLELVAGRGVHVEPGPVRRRRVRPLPGRRVRCISPVRGIQT